MTEIVHRTLDAGGLRMHVAEAGEGPLVLLLHGFPECWYSWRHQLPALAEAGYHAVAPDQRGFGDSDRPERIEEYSMLHLTGDVIGLIDALGERQAVLVGHDWGAPVAWYTTMLRPDRVRGVAGLSVGHQPPGAGGLFTGPIPPVTAIREAVGERFYMLYFQEPGVAEAELGADPRTTVRRFLTSAAGDAAVPWQPVLPPDGGFLDTISEPERLPDWLTEPDLDVYAAALERSGFAGPLNWYRTLDLNWDLLRRVWHKATIAVPGLYMAGDRDLVIDMGGGPDVVRATQRGFVPHLHDALFLPGCGHWTQQERPADVNAALLDFLGSLP
jgi:epoxide hydrolase A/B